ncbi:hypothetical protein [Trinickia sp.]|uniref:hypothetical protein n=1 Tax=Trinickia sp. TaxID=2571163 RepID=UPI003F8097B7
MLKSNVISVVLPGLDYEVVERLLHERAELVEFIGSNKSVSGAISDESRRVDAITAELTDILGKNALAATLAK